MTAHHCPHCEQPINLNIVEAPRMLELAASLEAKDRMIDELKAELAKERARLDAIMRNEWVIFSNDPKDPSSWHIFSMFGTARIARGNTGREAIDLAIEATR